ncbi:MAG: hypothetical protein D3925_07850 [Candidatus Electrothrix sp. AR5]|nr:hypothetical protein [Candidatus Electrothrix sp. AR5]
MLISIDRLQYRELCNVMLYPTGTEIIFSSVSVAFNIKNQKRTNTFRTMRTGIIFYENEKKGRG